MAEKDFVYRVKIPGYAEQEVRSDRKLTDLEAYDYAKQYAQPRTAGQEFNRGVGLMLKGMIPVATGATAGFALGGPPGAFAGSLALPLAEIATQGVNLALPKDYQMASPSAAVEGLLTRIGLPVAETTPERIIQASGGVLPSTAVTNAGMQVLSRTAQSQLGRNIAGEMAKAPERQLMAAVPATAAGQYTTDVTGRPELGMLASMATSLPFAIGTRPSGPSRETLVNQANAAYNAAETSGITFNPNKFSNSMSGIAAGLRKEGYTPTAYPRLQAVFNELTNVNMPKDFTELQGLRKMIRGAQSSIDPEERRLATILKNQFDDYVVNSSKNDIMGAVSKEGVSAWNLAKNTYARNMKAEVFDDMLANAEIEKGRASVGNYLNGQIKNLAKNDNKMRLFTADEQKEIIAAAKGSTTEKILALIGRLSPTANIFTGGGNIAFATSNPVVGIPLAATTAAARYGSNRMRQQSIGNLADTMRRGGLYPKETSAANALAARGLLSPQQQQVTEEEINLLMGR
jgi:hypothetical protein